jgi:hypothetical protein
MKKILGWFFFPCIEVFGVTAVKWQQHNAMVVLGTIIGFWLGRISK